LVIVAVVATVACLRVSRASEDEEPVEGIVTAFPQPMLANVTDAYQAVRLWPRSDALTAARDALEQPCEAAPFTETPLRTFLAAIADKAGVRIALDTRELDTMGCDPDTPITATITGLSFRAGLRTVLEDIGLAAVFRNDRVEITSLEKAQGLREIVFYPVIAGVNLDDVALLIEDLVAPESWSHRGGPGTVVTAPPGMGSGVIVSHNGDVQAEIEAVLRHLDGAVWIPEQQDDDTTPTFVRTYAIADDDPRDGLAERLLALCNDALPHGADPDAQIEVLGRSLIVRSRSRPFQIMAAQIIAALVGEEFVVEIEADDTTPAPDTESST